MADSTSTSVVVTAASDRVTLVRIDRPHVHNALNGAVLRDIADAIRSATADPSVRAIVITGTGNKAFSAGADLGELADLDARCAERTLQIGQHAMRTIESSPIPVIAAVNGLALGGGFELALSCTFLVLADSAQLGLPEAGLGLIPGYGGTQRLARRVGVPVAAHLMLTGERVRASRAYGLGITPVEPVPVDNLLNVTLEIAETIARRGPAAVTAILTSLRHGADAPLSTGLELEAALAAIATSSAEAHEGVAAFRDKRIPVFTDPRLRTAGP